MPNDGANHPRGFLLSPIKAFANLHVSDAAYTRDRTLESLFTYIAHAKPPELLPPFS